MEDGDRQCVEDSVLRVTVTKTADQVAAEAHAGDVAGPDDRFGAAQPAASAAGASPRLSNGA